MQQYPVCPLHPHSGRQSAFQYNEYILHYQVTHYQYTMHAQCWNASYTVKLYKYMKANIKCKYKFT